MFLTPKTFLLRGGPDIICEWQWDKMETWWLSPAALVDFLRLKCTAVSVLITQASTDNTPA